MGGLNENILAWEDIISAFRKPTMGYPVAAARAVLDNAENYEKLVAEFDRISAQPQEMIDSMFHLHAMHLLAEKREPRAFAPLMRIAALPDDVLDEVLGDHLTETFPNCVAATCRSEADEQQVHEFIENHEAAEWARKMLVESLVLRVMAGDAALRSVLDWLLACGQRTRQYLQENPASSESGGDQLVINGLASAIASLGSAEQIPLVQSWFDADLLDPQIADIDWFIKKLNTPLAERWKLLLRDQPPYIGDAIADMSNWYCFSERFHRPRQSARIISSAAMPEKQLPSVREQPKTGRNDPCPCGSGKKYKKCCGG